jgi:hypothetical protein
MLPRQLETFLQSLSLMCDWPVMQYLVLIAHVLEELIILVFCTYHSRAGGPLELQVKKTFCRREPMTHVDQEPRRFVYVKRATIVNLIFQYGLSISL